MLTLLHSFWPFPALLASALCALTLRSLLWQPGATKAPRSWFLAALVVVGTLLCFRYSVRLSPIGHRERLEQHTGLRLPFWPRDVVYHDDAKGLVVGYLRLSPREASELPPGNVVTPQMAASSFSDATKILKAEQRIPADGDFRRYTRCELGWYSLALVDRKSGKLWAMLFYTTTEDGALPCIPD